MSAILQLQNPPRLRGGFETIVRGPLLGKGGEALTEDQWRGGVSGETLPAPLFFSNGMVGGSWGDPTAGDVKPASAMGDEVEFKPSSVGDLFQCEMNAPNTVRGDIVLQHARNEMNRALWSLIARHIQVVGTSIECPGQPGANPTLQGVAKLPEGYDDDAPGNIEGVVQGLLDMVCAGSKSDPVFMAPLSWKSHFSRRGIVRWDEEQQAYILLGTHRIAFDCIDNVGPDGTTTNDDGSEVWIYAMLPPDVSVAAEGDGDVVAARAELRNVYHVRVERQFGYWFDTNNVYAAKATIL